MSRTYRSIERADFNDGFWRKQRDKKRRDKPTKKFKKILKNLRKAKEKQALREGKEPPKFRREDRYVWS